MFTYFSGNKYHIKIRFLFWSSVVSGFGFTLITIWVYLKVIRKNNSSSIRNSEDHPDTTVARTYATAGSILSELSRNKVLSVSFSKCFVYQAFRRRYERSTNASNHPTFISRKSN